MIWFVTFVSCIGLIGAKPSPPFRLGNEKVVGGQNAEPNKWKWHVSLQMGSYDWNIFRQVCGGTLIDAFHVMTSASCLVSSNPREYKVVPGEYDIHWNEESEQPTPVDRIIFHPGWNGDPGNGNDIAIMKLSQPIQETASVAIAELPVDDQLLPHGLTCYVTGWGATDIWGNTAHILQEAPLSVVEHSICSQPEWWGSLARENMICAGGDGAVAACWGDSGGPLSCFTDGTWKVYGVASYGPTGVCNQYQKPTVFTRVSSFLDWIYSVSLD